MPEHQGPPVAFCFVARLVVALLGLLLIIAAEYQPYVSYMELRWWESWGQVAGGVSLIILAFIPKED